MQFCVRLKSPLKLMLFNPFKEGYTLFTPLNINPKLPIFVQLNFWFYDLSKVKHLFTFKWICSYILMKFQHLQKHNYFAHKWLNKFLSFQAENIASTLYWGIILIVQQVSVLQQIVQYNQLQYNQNVSLEVCHAVTFEEFSVKLSWPFFSLRVI